MFKRLWYYLFPVWTPFNKEGYLDIDRLTKEGWHFLGSMDECFGCGEVNKPGCPTGECCKDNA